jgi:hypothetical protein
LKKQLRVEQLEGRDVPAAVVSTPTEAFSWVLINEMRQDPAGFANQLNGLRNGTIPSAFGFTKSDPVVADLNRLLQYSIYPSHYGTALKMLRSAAPTGPLGWDDTLADRADIHTAWMKTHAFEHTGVDGANKGYVAGYRTSYNGGSPDQWGYSGQYYWWGENIGYTYGLMTSSKAAFSAGQIGRIGFQERAAFIDTVSYVLEVNSPNMAHLEQLIAPDGGPANGHPQFNAVGMNLEFYEGPAELRDGLAEATISTHRLGLYQPGGTGGFITGVAYKDANGNGTYDAGEGIGATLQFSGPATFTETLDRLSTQGMSSNYVPNGTYAVTATAADGTPLGTHMVTINNRNAWFAFRQTSSSARPIAAPATSPSATTAVRPTVSWNPIPDAVGYQVRLINKATGIGVFPGATSLGTSWSATADLVPGTAYRVAIRPLFADRDGTWSPFADFKVDVPIASGPVGITRSATPAFTWTGVAGAARYVIIIDDLTTGQRVATVRTTDTNWMPSVKLANGHNYRWQVSARNVAGLGMWSMPMDFQVRI